MTEVSTAEGTGGDIAATGDIPLWGFLLTPRPTQKDALRLRVGLGN